MAKTRAQAKTKPEAPTQGERFVCVHGHFYQPPRENPWLETVEVQDSAAPYHDWNDRITAECYAPNGASRITDKNNEIIRIINNYARMSFNFGPTLLSWLDDNAPRTYRMIIDADRSQRAALRRPRLGDGAGLQPHHHAARQPTRRAHADPLGHRRLRVSLRPQARRHVAVRDRRQPQTSSTCSPQEGIRFTVLAPHQCARVRPAAAARSWPDRRGTADGCTLPSVGEVGHIDAKLAWTETPNASVDPTHPYSSLSMKAATSPSSSTMAPAPAPSPSRAC